MFQKTFAVMFQRTFAVMFQQIFTVMFQQTFAVILVGHCRSGGTVRIVVTFSVICLIKASLICGFISQWSHVT